MMRAFGIALIVVATAAYFYHWDTVPDGYYTDAASNVLNALCISHTGADEYGRFLPTTIRAFDDYRPPLLIYLFSIGNFLHPLTVASARLMSMVLGWGALFSFLIVYIKRFPLPVIHWPIFYPLLFGLVLCSSWVLIPHRMPVEYVTTLPVTLFLLLSSWRWIQEPDSHRAALVAALATGLMLYAYQATKPIAFSQVPVLFAVHFFYHRRLPKPAYTYLAVWGFLVAPTLIDLLMGGEVSLARYRAVGGANPFEVVAAFFQHLGPDFLFFEGDRNWRHHTGLGGMLNIALLPLAVAGGIALCKEVFLRRNAFWIFITLFLVTALLPVSLTREGLPHAIRALPAVIPLIMVLILGFASIENILRDRNDQLRSIVLTGFLLLGCWKAYENVEYYQGMGIDWTYFPESYERPSIPLSPFDHSADSINERYERVALLGDLRYCCEEDALQSLEQAIDSASSQERDTPGTHVFDLQKSYALALVHEGRRSDALEVMRHIYAIETEPALDAYDLSIHEEWSLITFTFAEEALARGDTTDARRFYEESLVAAKRIADSIQAPLLYRNLSMIYHRLGAYREAIVYYSKSFGAEENPTPTMIDIGNSYVQEGKEELGIFAYQIALELGADMTAEDYTSIGNSIRRAGGQLESTEAYSKAVEADPSYPIAQANLGWNLFLEERDEDAIKHLRVARALQPTPEVLYQLGLACLRSGQIDAARSAYREGVELFGANSGVELRVPQYLQWCIQEDIYPEIAREILFQYWRDGR